MAEPILLIDADVTLYKSAFASEVEIDWGDDLWTLHSELGEAREIFKEEINKIKVRFPKEFGMVLCFSGDRNWRNIILPTYKQNRKKIRKPIVLKPLRAWAMEHYDFTCEPSLEADDLLGLMSPNNIMVSVDKDLQTVAGKHYNPSKDELYEVSEEQAHYNHMFQTLCGDSTDGYSGCPSVGAKTAEKILDVPTKDMWSVVVDAYKKKGLTYEDTLIQARVARILRGDEYNMDTGEMNLWIPEDEPTS